MSAIFGIISKKDISKQSILAMKQPFLEYTIDRMDERVSQNIYMGCGIQYISDISEKEVLPIYSEKTGIYLTADCVIDNRDQLLDQLQIKNRKTTDGEIFYQAYLKWGETFVTHFLGIFSYAIYDGSRRTLILGTDYTSSRCLHYYTDKENVYFSTLMKPICNVVNPSFNERWIADWLSIDMPIVTMKSGETLYTGIKKVRPGSYLLINQDGIQEKKYWEPYKNRKNLILKSEDEYKEKFKALMQDIISDSIDTNGQVGICLSSGLDSTTVACNAAILLSKKGKKLYSYTGVPVKEFKYESKYYIANESEGVMEVCKRYPNIVPTFCDFDGQNCVEEAKRIAKILEFPNKSYGNDVMMDGLYMQAANNGCKILLSGNAGNSTISYGNIYSYVKSQMKHARVVGGIKELCSFCKKYHFSRKRLLKYYLRAEMKFGPTPKEVADEIRTYTFINKDLLMKQHPEKRILKSGYCILNTKISTVEDNKKNAMLDEQAFLQMGEFETKYGLMYGLVARDPTRDKRMIEFCMSLPEKCFANKEGERRLVRCYMKGIVPDAILDDINRRGRQTIDWYYRIQNRWEQVSLLLKQAYKNETLKKYIDMEKLNQSLSEFDPKSEDNPETVMKQFVYIYNLAVCME